MPYGWLLTQAVVDNRDDIKLRDGVIGAIQEGIELAENAFNVMKDHGSDEQVQKMCKFILGDDNFQNKFEQAKCEYTRHTFRIPDPCPCAGTNVGSPNSHVRSHEGLLKGTLAVRTQGRGVAE